MTLTQAKEDGEEYTPQWIAEIEKMMQPSDKKKIDKDFERSLFILGGFEPGAFGTPLGDMPEGSRNVDAAGRSGEVERTDGDDEMVMN